MSNTMNHRLPELKAVYPALNGQPAQLELETGLIPATALAEPLLIIHHTGTAWLVAGDKKDVLCFVAAEMVESVRSAVQPREELLPSPYKNARMHPIPEGKPVLARLDVSQDALTFHFKKSGPVTFRRHEIDHLQYAFDPSGRDYDPARLEVFLPQIMVWTLYFDQHSLAGQAIVDALNTMSPTSRKGLSA